ncbi:MAG: hypothetical protein ACLFVK_00930 [Dehalococcoidia bacterium]
MTLQVRLRPEAEQDVEEAAHWYEQQKEGLVKKSGVFRRSKDS